LKWTLGRLRESRYSNWVVFLGSYGTFLA